MKIASMLAAVGLLTIGFALGAVACSDDSNDAGGTTPQPTTAAGETPTEAAGTTPGATTASGETPGGEAPGGFTTVVVTEDDTLGAILTTYDGLTVYTFDSDTGGTSACTGDCVNTWQPLPSAGEPTGGEGVTGTLATITRDDGSTQVTYDGKPLYLYSGDPSPGDTNGNGFGGLWHVVTIE